MKVTLKIRRCGAKRRNASSWFLMSILILEREYLNYLNYLNYEKIICVPRSANIAAKA
jgi:hypothetical protein